MSVKDVVYSDGTGDVNNHRSMASTLLAFGTPWSKLQAMDDTLLDLQAMMGSTQPPPWPYDVDEALVGEGLSVYQGACATCHGDLCDPSVGYPDRVVAVEEVGTDPTRSTRWTSTEAAWANISWFGEPGPMRDTDGYLANPLRGSWATAPFLHNGSVPDLASLLDSSTRPDVWQRTGSGVGDYDPVTVGWRFTTPTAPASRATVEARRVVDTHQPGMSNTGHTYGDALTDEQRSALMEFLKTL
jgi:mono/diheme cytochrome c family protein